MKTKKKNATGKILAATAGAVALSAVAYYLLGPDGKKNQKKVVDWTHKMKQEVLKKMSKAKHVSKDVFEEAVDHVATFYKKEKSISAAELAKMIKQVKAQWGGVVKSSKKPIVKKKTTIVKKVGIQSKAKKAKAKK